TRLTHLVATANGVIYRKRAGTLRTMGRFFTHTFPGAVYHCRRTIAVAAVVFFAPAIVTGIWLTLDHGALARSASPGFRAAYVNDKFSQYYSDRPSAQFFTEAFTNHVKVSFMAFAV